MNSKLDMVLLVIKFAFGILVIGIAVYLLDIIRNKIWSQFQRLLAVVNPKVVQSTSNDHD